MARLSPSVCRNRLRDSATKRLDVSTPLRSLAVKTGTRRAFSTTANSPIDVEREPFPAISMLFGGHTRTGLRINRLDLHSGRSNERYCLMLGSATLDTLARDLQFSLRTMTRN